MYARLTQLKYEHCNPRDFAVVVGFKFSLSLMSIKNNEWNAKKRLKIVIDEEAN